MVPRGGCHQRTNANNSIKGYLLLYQEGVLTNLLEAMLYHKQGCEACGDLVVELVDYCHRKLMFLSTRRRPTGRRTRTS